MRIAALVMLPLLLPLSGCQSFVQNVYDEQAEQECYDLPGIEAQRACLNDLEHERIERRSSGPEPRS